MALPILWWVLRCDRCGAMQLVEGERLEHVGVPAGHEDIIDAGYGERTIAELYECAWWI